MALGTGAGLGTGTFHGKSKPSLFGNILHGVGAVTTKPAANLLTDVKDAAVGLPMGLVQTVQHPLRTGENMVNMTWHTWSPLFHGDFQKFGKQVYDHPLAPILDVVSVLSLGLGSAAKVADVSLGAAGTARVAAKIGAGESLSGAGEKLASLRMGKKVRLSDPNEKLLDVEKYLSRRPLRRSMQEGLLKLDQGGHLPNFYVKGRYKRLHLVDMAHRSIAKTETHAAGLTSAAMTERGLHPVQQGADPRLGAADIYEFADDAAAAVGIQTHVTVSAARALEDITETGRKSRMSIVAGMFANFTRHNRLTYDEAAARKLVEGNPHNDYIMDPAFIDPVHRKAVERTRKQHSRATRELSAHNVRTQDKVTRLTGRLEDAQSGAAGIERTEADLAKANAELADIYEQGHVIKGGARTQDGSNRLITNPNRKQLANYETQRAHTLHKRIADLTAKRERALKNRATAERLQKRLDTHENKTAQLEARVQEKHDMMNAQADRSTEEYFAWAGETYEKTKGVVNNFGKVAMTGNIKHALRDTDGKIFVAPKHDAYSLGIEAEGSLHFLHTILHKPTQVWKTITVGYTPRTITNNGVGNWFMYGVATAGPRGIQAFTDALQYQFGKKVIGDNVFAKDHVIDRWFQDELGDQFGVGNEITKLGFEERNATKFSKQWWGKHARQGFYPIVQKTSERPVRVASIYHTLGGFAEVKAEIKLAEKRGLKGIKAREAGMEAALKKHPNLRGETALQSRRLAGDYVTMTQGEKWARDIIPFYLWDRHILKHTGNMFLEHPGRVATGAKLGDMGLQETEKLVGELPDFLKGAIPLAALGFGDHTGRMNLLSTASLNPYATVGDLADSVASWTTGGAARRGAALSQVNPFIVGSAESVFQTSALTGVPSPRHGGVLEDVFGRTMSQFPYVKAAGIFSSGDQFKTPKGNDLLFGQTKTTAISSLLGVPIKDTSRGRSDTLVEQLNGKKKGGLG